VQFTAADAYTVVDEAGSEVTSDSYASGEDIVFGGVRMRIQGSLP